MKVPICDSDVTFESPHVFWVSTAYSKIRKYDIRIKNQAIIDHLFNIEVSPINHIMMDHSKDNLIIGNNKGGVYFLDKNNLAKNQILKKINCSYTSISDMKLHPT